MKLVNSLTKPNHQAALSLIEAIESDFTVIDKVLIKADWVMQNAVTILQEKTLSQEDRANLIEQLSSAIASVQKQLYQSNECTSNDEQIVA